MSTSTSLRAINDDVQLRPFLSSVFDAQQYIKNVIKEERSEECFATISACIEDVNADIKGYISQHKDDLMSGMQDVATLADRYTNLSSASQQLHRNIERLKKEVVDAYDSVSSKTIELERIHDTSKMLHLLKQFAHSKAQLDQYMKNGEQKDKSDTRNLSAAAKTLSELEKILKNQRLLEIKFVAENVTNIKLFGQNLRLLAQDRLLQAIADKNQASIASSLQVFYNLESLPEVILMVIDHIVKQTVELSRDALDFETLDSQIQTELLSSSNAPVNVIPQSASKRPTANPPQPLTLPQLRLAIRELAHLWSSSVYDKTIQVQVLQRVISKKEDPTTNEKFIDVLKKLSLLSNNNNNITSFLSQGNIIDLYWERLSISLQDIASDKLRNYPNAASRSYPYIRKAGFDILENIKQISDNNNINVPSDSSNNYNLQDSNNSREGTFGSLQWSQEDLLSSIGFGLNKRFNSHNSSTSLTNSEIMIHNNNNKYRERWAMLSMSVDAQDNSNKFTKNDNEQIDHDLITGLKPLRDRYLINVLNRMTGPIMQMFPEMEGYTAAIPSKRDLQALIKSIQNELVTCVIESDSSLVTIVSKEFLKTNKLMLTKIEGMIINSSETRKISSTNNFSRTNQQEHNGQLLSLLIQYRDALQKIPASVMKSVIESNTSTSLLTNNNSNNNNNNGMNNLNSLKQDNNINDINNNNIFNNLQKFANIAAEVVDELAKRQILDSIIALLSGYIRSILMNIYKEGVVNMPSKNNVNTSTSSSSGIDESSLECSNSVQIIIKQVPLMIKSYLQGLPKSNAVDWAIEEVCLRIIHSYVTISSLIRPINEQIRLRTAKDMAALEVMISSIISISQPSCPVMQEFRSFRRLLFQEDSGIDTSTSSSGVITSTSLPSPPNGSQLLKQPYLTSLRPSIIINYMISCGPLQLPLPYEITPSNTGISTGDKSLVNNNNNNNNNNIQSYIEFLTEIDSSINPSSEQNENGNQTNNNNINKDDIYSVCSLYISFQKVDSRWNMIENEKRNWELIQLSLDIFFQRLSVIENSAQKQTMRLWYENVMDISSHLLTSKVNSTML
eukprot:gene11157-14969_t